MKPMRYWILSCFLVLLIAFSSCDRDRMFEENRQIPDGVWKMEEHLIFSVDITDSLSLYTFYLNIRNDVSYSYANLYMFLKTRFPDGSIARDTIECQLAGYDGHWIGSGMGSVRFNRFLFQQGIRFSMPGTYRFELEQAMRVKELKGIRDAGIRIEKMKTQ